MLGDETRSTAVVVQGGTTSVDAVNVSLSCPKFGGDKFGGIPIRVQMVAMVAAVVMLGSCSADRCDGVCVVTVVVALVIAATQSGVASACDVATITEESNGITGVGAAGGAAVGHGVEWMLQLCWQPQTKLGLGQWVGLQW